MIWYPSKNSHYYLVVAVLAGTLLPHLARRDHRLISHEDEDEDVEITRLRNTVREWRAEAARQGRPLRLPMMPFLLRNIWTGALLLFTIITFSTFFITTVAQVYSCTYEIILMYDAADFVRSRQLSQSVWSEYVGLWRAGCHSLSSWRQVLPAITLLMNHVLSVYSSY